MYNVNSLIVTAVIIPLLGVVAVALRFYVRLRLTPTYVGVDDWAIALSCLLVCGIAADIIVGATQGELGRDADLVEPQRVSVEAKVDFSTLIIEKFAYTSIKLSVLFFYRRIFVYPTFRRVNNALIVIITLWGVAFLFAAVFSCGVDSHAGHPCSGAEWNVLWFAITDVIGDIAVLTMPYPCIRRLQMSTRDKIRLIAIFLLGTLSVVFGIVRLGFVVKTFTIYFHPSDSKTSPNRTPPPFWTLAEISVGVLAACLPALNPLIRRLPSPSQAYMSLKYNLMLHSGRSSSTRILNNDPGVEHANGLRWVESSRKESNKNQGRENTAGNRHFAPFEELNAFEMTEHIDVV